MTKIHCFLLESGIGAQELRRIDPKTVLCHLEDGSEYRLNVDERDQRALVVFDGEVLFGGLPKNTTIVHVESIGTIYCPAKQMRKEMMFPYFAFPKYYDEGAKVGIELQRYFILLPSCVAIVRKYRQKNLMPIYVLICVHNGQDGKKIVEWQTTSY